MQTSRFELGLMVSLALGLGFTLSSATAIGYPAGPSVSFSANPIVATGGTTFDAESKPLFTAPADQDLIVTDLVLTSTSHMQCKKGHLSELTLGSGAVLGQFETSSSTARRYYEYDSSAGVSIQHNFGSGLRIPAGDSLTMNVTETSSHGDSCSPTTSYGVRYSVSGYFAQP